MPTSASQTTPGAIDGNPTELMAAAKAAFASGAFDEAAQIAERVLAIQPKNPSASKLFARALTGAGRHDASCDAWARAAALSPNAADVRLNLARACRKSGKYLETAVAAAALLDLEPANQDGLRLLAQALGREKNGAFPDSVWHGLRRLPVDAFMELAQQLESQKRFRDLAQALKIYTDERPDEKLPADERARVFKLLIARGKSFEQWDNIAEAAECFGAACLLESGGDSALRLLRRLVKPIVASAREAQKNKDYDAAATAFESALRYEPGNAVALAGMARICEIRSEWREACGFWRSLTDVEPENSFAWLRLGLDSERSQQFPEALEAFGRVAAPEHETAASEGRERVARQALRAARAAYASEQLDLASDMILVAQSIDGDAEHIQKPKARIVRGLRAQCKESYAKGEHADVVERGRRLAALGDDDTSTLVTIARSLAAQRMFADALDAWSRAESASPEHPAVALGIARALASMSRFDEALVAARKATEIASAADKARELIASLEARKGS